MYESVISKTNTSVNSVDILFTHKRGGPKCIYFRHNAPFLQSPTLNIYNCKLCIKSFETSTAVKYHC